jgi:GrpB-like predicted nucleotidyltransferase (UPF0157 family)
VALPNTVELVPPDPGWPARFRAVRDELRAVLDDADVEHIGSTSVPGLASKDTVDVAVAVDDVATALTPAVLAALAERGFVLVPGSFADDPDHAFLHRVVGGRRVAHVHVVRRDSDVLASFLLFRDFLRADPDAAARYARAKADLARRFAARRDRYVDEKEAVVAALLVEAAAWHDEAARSGRGSDEPAG